MPGLNGYEVAKQLRPHPDLKHVVLVALSPLKTTSGTLFCSSIRDVTERVADKNSILEGVSRLALAVKVSKLAIAEIDYATGMNHLSADAARLFGLGEVAMTVPRAAVHATFHPDDSPELLRRIAESLSPTGEGWFAMDQRRHGAGILDAAQGLGARCANSPRWLVRR